MKYRVMILSSISFLVLWLLLPLLLQWVVPDSLVGGDVEKIYALRGQYGDMYGVITSLFSGLTLAGLIFTIIQQQEQVSLARLALKDQKAELEFSRQESENQNKTNKIQRFENTFFKMIELHSFITNEITYRYQKLREGSQSFFETTTVTINGKQAIMAEYQNLLECLPDGNFSSDDSDLYYLLANKYETYIEETRHKLDRYFLNIKTIEEFILGTYDTGSPEALFYMNIFALQLDNNELALFFYQSTLMLNKRYIQNSNETTGNDRLVNYVNPASLKNESHINLFYTSFVNGDV